MNIVVHYSQFELNNVLFLEKKKNIIVDGTFTKIVYSDDNMCMNGIYLYFPITTHTISHSKTAGAYSPQNENGKYKYSGHYSRNRGFAKHPSDPNIAETHHTHEFVSGRKDVEIDLGQNTEFIQQISNIETDILSYYKHISGTNKNINYSLRNQIMSGSLNVSCFDYPPTHGRKEEDKGENAEKHRYILKISGIWETTSSFGITYKFIHMKKRDK